MVEGAGEVVHAEDIEAPVLDEGGDAGHAVEQVLDAGAELLRHAPALPGRLEVRCAGEVEQVGAFGVVEFQGAGEGFEDAVGDAGEVSALEPVVVVDAHAGDHREFFAAEAGHAAEPAVDLQPCHFRGEPGAAGLQELLTSLLFVTISTVRADHVLVGGTAITWNTSHYLGFRAGRLT